MAHKYESVLQQWSDYLQDGIDLLAMTAEPELNAVKINVGNHLLISQRRIHGLLGTARPIDAASATSTSLPPMTQMFGKAIEFERKPVTADQTQPTNFEKEKFIREVEDYYQNFANIDDERLFKFTAMPGGTNIIRGVAKKAGIEDAATAEITNALFAAIRAAISTKNKAQGEVVEAEKKINSKRNAA